LKQKQDLLDRGAQLLLQKETLNEDDLRTLREPQSGTTGKYVPQHVEHAGDAGLI